MRIKKICFTILSFLIITSVAFAEDLMLTGELTSDWLYIHGTIFTQDDTIIESGVNLDLIAKTKIKFDNGFKIRTGGVLLAGTSPDTDSDMIFDLVENRTCTNPYLDDTDSDGLSDGFEDSNRNGIFESALGEINPCNPDTDGDRMGDKYESDYGLDPNFDDSNEDPDNDSFTNWMEFFFSQSDPRDPNHRPDKGSYYEYDELGRIKKIIRVK